MLKRVGTEGLKSAGTEGLTEFGQSIINNVGAAYETGTDLPPNLLEQAVIEGVTGSVVGKAIGTTTAAVEEVAARGAPIRELAGAEFTTTPQQQAMNVVQQREAAARGEVVGRPATVVKVDATPRVLTQPSASSRCGQ